MGQCFSVEQEATRFDNFETQNLKTYYYNEAFNSKKERPTSSKTPNYNQGFKNSKPKSISGWNI